MPAPTKLRLFMRESLENLGEPQETFKVTIADMKLYSEYFGVLIFFVKKEKKKNRKIMEWKIHKISHKKNMSYDKKIVTLQKNCYMTKNSHIQ